MAQDQTKKTEKNVKVNTAAKSDQPNKDRTWAMACHLTALVGLLGIPFGNVLGPLVTWLIKKNEMPLVDQEGKESLNFQISMSIYMAIAAVLCLIVIGFLLLIPLIIADVIFVIMASVKTSNGEKFTYPLTIRFFH
jgi:uncharacterized protein